jgi:hypothetical protein
MKDHPYGLVAIELPKCNRRTDAFIRRALIWRGHAIRTIAARVAHERIRRFQTAGKAGTGPQKVLEGRRE